MSIADNVELKIKKIEEGRIFSYSEFSDYKKSPSSVVKIVAKMLADNRIKKLSKGKFYKPKKGFFGERKPSDSELIRSFLYKNGKRSAYVTGLSVYNKLGLTTQVPRVIMLASKGSRIEKDFGTIVVKTKSVNVPIEEKNIKLLQYLDALKDIKNIMDSDINLSLKIMKGYILELSDKEKLRLLKLAEKYYQPQVKALVGLLFTSIREEIPSGFIEYLNPTTSFKLDLNQDDWPDAKQWRIQ